MSPDLQELFYKKLGELIKAARKRSGYKQEALSKHVGLTRISIVHIEQGTQKVQLHTLMQIAKYLDMSVAELIPPLDSIQQEISPKLVKKIENEGLDKAESKEKLTAFLRISTNK